MEKEHKQSRLYIRAKPEQRLFMRNARTRPERLLFLRKQPRIYWEGQENTPNRDLIIKLRHHQLHRKQPRIYWEGQKEGQPLIMRVKKPTRLYLRDSKKVA